MKPHGQTVSTEPITAPGLIRILSGKKTALHTQRLSNRIRPTVTAFTIWRDTYGNGAGTDMTRHIMKKVLTKIPRGRTLVSEVSFVEGVTAAKLNICDAPQGSSSVPALLINLRAFE